MTEPAEPQGIPPYPRVVLTLLPDGSGTINGRGVHIPRGADRHALLMTEACRFAATLGRPVRVTASDAVTEWELVAHPDGGVTALGPGRARETASRPGLVSGPDREGPAARAISWPSRRLAWLSRWRQAGRRRGPRPAPPPAGVPQVGMPPAVLRSAGFRPPGLRLLGGLVVSGLLLASLAAIPLSGGTPTTAEQRVVTTVTAGDGAGSAASSASSAPAAPVLSAVRGKAAPASSTVDRLAVVGPPGYSARPAWVAPIAGWTGSTATDDGTVLSRDPEGHVVLVDPRSGGVRWRSAEATRSGQSGPWLTRIDGSPAAAVVAEGLLSYWTLPGASGDLGGPAVGVRLPAGARVSWAGAAPLVTWRGGAGVIRGGALQPVALPKRAAALATDGTTVVAVAGATYVRQVVARRVAKPRRLPQPKGAAARPARVEAVGTSFLLVAWPRTRGGGQVVGLVETRSGKLLVQTIVDAELDVTHGSVVREAGGIQTVVGSVVVDTYHANLNLLDPRYTVRAVTRGHAWATLAGGRATDIHLTRSGDFVTVPFPAGEPALPVGVVSPNGSRPRAIAVVVAPSGDGWILCGLPATSTPATPTPSTSSASTSVASAAPVERSSS